MSAEQWWQVRRQTRIPRQELIRAVQKATGTMLVHLVLIALFFWPVLMGQYTFIQDWDSADQSFCWLTKVFAAIQRGQLVLWDFGIMSGVSFIGELQTSPLYPPALLLGLFARIGDPTYVDYFFVLHFLVAALGMQALACSFRLPWLAGLGGAIIYAYASVFTERVGGQGNLFVGLAWIPWAATAAKIAITARPYRNIIFFASMAGVAIALALLGGHNSSAVYAALSVGAIASAAAIIALLRSEKREFGSCALRSVILLVAAGVSAVLLALPQLIATDEYLQLSYKWYGPGYTTYPHIVPYGEYVRWGLRVRDLLTIVTGGPAVPEGGTLFVTWIGAACATLALIVGFRRRGSGLGVLLASGGLLLALSLVMAYPTIPPFGRIFYNIPVINSLRIPSRATCLFAFAAAMLATGGLTIIFNIAGRITTHVKRPIPFKLSSALLGTLVLLLLIEARYVNWRFMMPLKAPNSEIKLILDGDVMRALVRLSRAQPMVYRYYGPRELVPPNLADVFPLLTTEGYRSSRTIAYHSYFDFNPLSERTNALGVRWWIADKDIPGLHLIQTLGDVRIYERPNALPIFSLTRFDGRRIAAPIERVEWGVNDVTVHFYEPVAGRLTFAQTQYPGWTATADGLPLAVRSDQELLSVVLPNVTHQVTFRYAPSWLLPSLIVSLAAFTCIMVIGISSLWTRGGRAQMS
jgi:hypothetical protein